MSDPRAVPVWLPYVRGERTPLHDSSLRASLHDLDLTHGPDAVRRAAYEASAFVARRHIELGGVDARRIVATGGGTRVEAWVQALADCTNLPVDVVAVPEGRRARCRVHGAGGRWSGQRDGSDAVGATIVESSPTPHGRAPTRATTVRRLTLKF